MKHLSRFDIEAIADKYVQAYMALPDVRNTQIYRIDPELLLEKVLGLNVEYQHLSYDGSILGMTSFTEMGVQVFEDDDSPAYTAWTIHSPYTAADRRTGQPCRSCRCALLPGGCPFSEQRPTSLVGSAAHGCFPP